MLRGGFEELRGQVLASVRAKLAGSGLTLDQGDLEACYAQAWQGLYAVLLEGQEVANPTGWLVLVTYRRAIEEGRGRERAHRGGDWCAAPARSHGLDGDAVESSVTVDRDMAAELDDRMRLRQLMEGLRGRLDAREREAATLCYLQGLSRSQAAARMGVSEARMRKLMEGSGRGRVGVAGKVGDLVRTIGDGQWCEEQTSLMRALAYGILDPDGERYQLALLHSSSCPSCRAYVASLRGLAAVLPPVLLPWALGAQVLARAASAHGGGVAASGGAGGVSGAGMQGGGEAGVAIAGGSVGAGGAGGVAGGWLLGGGPIGAKLAAGCLLTLTVGAGCVALDGGPRANVHRHDHRASSRAGGVGALGAAAERPRSSPGTGLPGAAPGSAGEVSAQLGAVGRASREFGPERALTAEGSRAPAAGVAPPSARSATAAAGRSRTSAELASGEPDSTGGAQSQLPAPAGNEAAATREFAPG